MNTLKVIEELAGAMTTPKPCRAPIGWHPAPNGLPELWYWDGHRWIDPIEQVESRIIELIEPHLEKMYRKGFEDGFNRGRSM